ncbi:hypothetical protein ACFYOT_20120 [Saccharothrix saharensis]|uniref:hypothetical protein n=1 Tax=Saccharothrix saharensis TaxID=571190 RepID=UPI003698B3E5
MAVTQQLVRIPAPHLAECRRSADAPAELCSYRAAPDEDHLDLDWWPAALRRAWELTGVTAMATLRLALDGDGEVNPSYRDDPDTIPAHPVTAVEPPRADAWPSCCGGTESHGSGQRCQSQTNANPRLSAPQWT